MDWQIVALVFTGVSALSAAANAITAWQNRRLAELDRMPMIGVRQLQAQVEMQREQVSPAVVLREPLRMAAIKIGVELFNAGKVMATYEMKSMTVTCANRVTDPRFLSRRGSILPGSSTVFWYDALKFEPQLDKFPAEGHLSCEFAVGSGSALLRHQSYIKASYKFVIQPNDVNSFQFQWFSVDDDVT